MYTSGSLRDGPGSSKSPGHNLYCYGYILTYSLFFLSLSGMSHRLSHRHLALRSSPLGGLQLLLYN